MSSSPNIAPLAGLVRTPDPRRQIHFLTDQVPPPAPLYVTSDDELKIIVWNSVASLSVQVTLRILRPDGQIVPQLETINPTSDRVGNTKFYPLQEGFILGVAVAATSGEQLGATYVQVAISRGGTGANGFFAQLLTSGYIGQFRALTWPGVIMEHSQAGPGNIRSITGSSPAAGAEIAETVPTGALWRLNSFQFGFTASANVATRYPELVIDDGANTLLQIDGARNITAGQAFSLGFGAGMQFRQSPQQNHDLYALPGPFILRPGYRVRTSTLSLQANDQYTAPQYQVEEWLTQ